MSLQGGNSRDPLNLGSLADEQVNKALNEHTPESSPLPTPKHRKEEIEVLIPPNICDPLNLNMPDNLAEQALISPNAATKKKKGRNRKRRRTNSASEVLDAGHKAPELNTPALDLSSVAKLAKEKESQQLETETATDTAATTTNIKEPKELKLKADPTRQHPRRTEDKIVSPVVPQPGARKRCGFFPRSISKDPGNKVQRQFTKGPSGEGTSSGNHAKDFLSGHQQQSSRVKEVKKFQYGNYDRYVAVRN